MSEVPKVVKQRAGKAAAGDHPDANLLAGFAEGALTSREREQVLEHLGGCAECREIVSLALPEVPAAAVPVAEVKQPWWRWPRLRWAGVAAAVVVVAAAVMIQKSAWRETAGKPTAVVAESQPRPEEAKPPEAAPAPAKSVDTSRQRKAAPKQGSEEKKVAQASSANGGLREKAETKQGTAAGFVGKEPFGIKDEDRAEKRMAPPHVIAPPPVQNLPLQTPRRQVTAAPAQPAASDELAAAGTGAPAASRADAAKLQSQAPASPSFNESVEVVAAEPRQRAKKAPAAQAANAMLASMAMRWRVSSEGALEGSNDGGRSWQRVRVAETPARFRTVSVVDGDVWVGGEEGALYHSADGGRTWKRVTVMAEDMVLATDIVRVEFTDARHGSVTAKDGATWVTEDGGETWEVRSQK